MQHPRLMKYYCSICGKEITYDEWKNSKKCAICEMKTNNMEWSRWRGNVITNPLKYRWIWIELRWCRWKLYPFHNYCNKWQLEKKRKKWKIVSNNNRDKVANFKINLFPCLWICRKNKVPVYLYRSSSVRLW